MFRSGNQTGFSLMELLVVLVSLAIIGAMAMPAVGSMQAQMKASEDIRAVEATLRHLREEAVRQKVPVSVTFESSRLSWDIGADGEADGSMSLSPNSHWGSGMPANLSFNGMGLARGAAIETEIKVENGNSVLSLTVNANGHVSFGS